MAGDWIKYDTTTHDKPELEQIALALGIDDPDLVVGKLMRFWSWADHQSADGDNLGVTSAFIDRIARCEGLAAALIEVGWLRDRKGKLSVPNFDRHNGQSAKARAEATERKRVSRIRHEKDVTKPRPEKRREDKSTSTPPPSPHDESGVCEHIKGEEELSTILILRFPRKPDSNTLTRIKHYGFEYDGGRSEWQARDGPGARTVWEEIEPDEAEKTTRRSA